METKESSGVHVRRVLRLVNMLLPAGSQQEAISTLAVRAASSLVDLPKVKMIVHLETLPFSISKCDSERRLALDFGGASIRLVLADVNLKTRSIMQKLFIAKCPIDFRRDLDQNENNLSEQIYGEAKNILLHLQLRIAKYQPVKVSAVATEAFRRAANSSTFIHRLSQFCGPISIISQEEEGRLGFIAGVTHSPASPKDTLVMDLGSGSIQITCLNEAGVLTTFGLKLGRVALDRIIAKKFGKTNPSDINPVTPEEAEWAFDYISKQLDAMPAMIKEKFKSEKTCVIATCASIIHNENAWGKDTCWEFLHMILGRTKDQLQHPLRTSRALFLYAFINKFEIKKCLLTGSDDREGSASGLLILPEYWK